MMDTDSTPDLETRRKRLRYRAWHRGFKEADLIMGRFADARLDDLSEIDLTEFERLLATTGLRDHRHIIFQRNQLLNAFAQKRMIVHQNNFALFYRHLIPRYFLLFVICYSSAQAGKISGLWPESTRWGINSSEMTAPPSAPASNRTSPPSSSARSLMVIMP